MSCKYILDKQVFNSKEELKEYFSQRKNITKDIIATFGGNTSTTITPYKGTDMWVGLVTRRVMQMASQEGYDGIAFATGQQSADMYDLARVIKKITYKQEGTAASDNSPIYVLTSTYQTGEQTTGTYRGDELENVVGKEVANKIVNNEGETSSLKIREGERTLSGVDLEVGGEGMKTFYDKIVTKVAQKEAQRFDKNAKLEEVDFNVDQSIKAEPQYDNEGNIARWKASKDGEDYIAVAQTEQGAIEKYKEMFPSLVNDKLSLAKQPYIAITNTMKESLNQAIPLFQKSTGTGETDIETANLIIEQLKKTGLANNVIIDKQAMSEYLAQYGVSSVQALIDIEGNQTGKTATIKKTANELETLAKSNAELLLSDVVDLTELKKLLKNTDLTKTKIKFNYDDRSSNEANAALYLSSGGVESIIINSSPSDFKRGAEPFKSEISILLAHENQHIYDRENGVNYGENPARVAEELSNRDGNVYNKIRTKGVLDNRQGLSFGIYLALRGEVKARRNALEEIGVTESTILKYEPSIANELLLDSYDEIKDIKEEDFQEYYDAAYNYLYDTESPSQDGLTYLKTDSGEIKGFATKDGQIFLDPDLLDPTLPIHEFSHLYINALEKNKNELFNRGLDLVEIELSKEDSDIREIIDYVKSSQPNLRGNEFKIELLAELIGRKGLDLIEKKAGKKASKIAEWISEVWDWFRQQSGLLDMTNEQVANMSLQEYADKVVIDLLKGENIFQNKQTRGEYGIGYTADTEQVARERFDIPNLEQIGKGSDRTVFKLDDNKVLKVAHSARGLAQNYNEGDYYLNDIVPEVYERGLNYVVVQETPRINNKDIVTTYDVDGNETGETTAGEMIKDLGRFSQRQFDSRDNKLQDIIYKYGFQDIFSYEVLYGDFSAKRNWGYLNGKAVHLDGGTFGGVRMLEEYKGVKNLDDADFRDVYNKSRQAKKEFGDLDKYTMFQKQAPKTTIQSRPYKGGRNFAIISDNKEVGRLKTVDYNGGLKITGVQVDEAERGKGITSNAYLNVVKQLSKEGVTLYSDGVRAPQTEKIWQNLLEQGVAEKTKEGNYKTVIFPSGYDANGEVNKEKLLEYAQSTDRKIQVKEKATVRNTLLATNLNSSKELVKKIKEAVIKNGLFMFDKRQMINSGLYNEYEASVILNTPALQESIKQMYNALSNSEEITVDVEGYSTEDFIVPISDELNTFGKRAVSNPYVKEKELHSLLADETDVDGTMTDGEFEQSYKKNKEFKKLANDIAKNVKTVSVKEITEDGLLEDKIEGSTLPILEKTLIDGYNEELSNKLKTLKSISDTVWKASSRELKVISTQITKAVINNGINLKGLPNIIGIRKREDTLDLLISIERMINFSTDVNKNVYSKISDNYFRRNEKKKDYVVTDDSRDFVLENSPLSEYELFSRYKIVRSRGNIYREVVSDANLEDMYTNSLGSNQLSNDLVEAKDYIKGVVAKVDISDDNVETEELEKMMLYKNYFNFPLEIKDNTKSFSRITEFRGDLEYSLDTFVKDFNKYLLETNNTLFKVTENGIEFTNDDVLSKQDALESLDDSILEELQNYSLVSTSISLDFENKDVDTEPQQKDRDGAINNPKAVKKAMGEYIYDDSNNTLVLRGATDTFVRTNKGLYELVYETPSLGIYGKLPTLESTPILGEKKPTIKSRDYTYLENKVSIFTEVNSTLSKAQKESINNEFFNCQK